MRRRVRNVEHRILDCCGHKRIPWSKGMRISRVKNLRKQIPNEQDHYEAILLQSTLEAPLGFLPSHRALYIERGEDAKAKNELERYLPLQLKSKDADQIRKNYPRTFRKDTKMTDLARGSARSCSSSQQGQPTRVMLAAS